MLPLTEYLYHTIGSKWKNTLCKEDQYKYDSEIGYCTYDEQALTEFGAMAAIGYHYTRSDFVVLIFRKPSEEDVEKQMLLLWHRCANETYTPAPASCTTPT